MTRDSDFLKKKLVKQYNLSDIQADSMSIGELIRYSVNHNSADIEIFEPKPETSPAETEMQPEKLVMEDQPNTDSSVTPSKSLEIEKNNSDKSSDKEYDSESKTDLSSDNKQKSKDNNAKNNSGSQNNGKTPDKNTSDKSVKDKTKPAKTKNLPVNSREKMPRFQNPAPGIKKNLPLQKQVQAKKQMSVTSKT